MRCKGCGNRLITTVASNKCIVCGRSGGMRASFGTVTWTKKGAIKQARGARIRRPVTTEAAAWQQAEIFVCAWMTKNGYRDARLSPPGADGGVDVYAAKAVAQVKHHIKPVGLPEIQRLYGIAQSMRRKALFFSYAGYTPKAREWAHQHGVALYVYPPVRKL